MLLCSKTNAKATCFRHKVSIVTILPSSCRGHGKKETALLLLLLLYCSTVFFRFFKWHIFIFHIQEKKLVGRGRWLAFPVNFSKFNTE